MSFLPTYNANVTGSTVTGTTTSSTKYLPNPGTWPVVAKDTLNNSATSASDQQLSIAGSGAPLRIIYGTVILGPCIANAILYNGDLIICAVWGHGEIEKVVQLYIEDKVIGSGITFSNYTGTSTQPVDALLKLAIESQPTNFAGSAEGIIFNDSYPNIAYSVIKIPSTSNDISGFPRITAKIQGLKVENNRTNYFKSSDELDSALWGKARSVVVPNATLSHNGSNTSDRLQISSAITSTFYLSQTSTLPANEPQQVTVYAKPDQITKINIILYADTVSNSISATATLTGNGTLVTASTGAGALLLDSCSITLTTNGFYKCCIVGTPNTGLSSSTRILIYLLNSAGNSSYLGTLKDGLYFGGIQLQKGTSDYGYRSSTLVYTGRSSIGTYLDNRGVVNTAPINTLRYSHNIDNLLAPESILIEKAATNLLVDSELLISDYGETYWTKGLGVNITKTQKRNPLSTSYNTEAYYILVENLRNSDKGIGNIYNTNPITVTASTNYSLSVFMLPSDSNLHPEESFVLKVVCLPSNTVFSVSTANTTPTGLWSRPMLTFTTPIGDTQLNIILGSGSPNAIKVFLHSIQLEVGEVSTSYIPTKLTIASRSGDSYTSTSTLLVKEYSEDPALCLADFIQNTTYGMGKQVDWPSVADTSYYCNTLIGTAPIQEVARTLNIALETVQPVQDWLDTLRTYAGCWVVPQNNSLKLVPDVHGQPIMEYSHDLGNILSISNIVKRGSQNTPTLMTLSYRNLEKLPAVDDTVEVYTDDYLYNRKESLVSLPGITRKSQAYREASERLNKLTLNDLSFSITVFDEALALDVGDIITVSHPIGFVNKQMRVISINGEYGRYTLNLIEYDPAVYSYGIEYIPTWNDIEGHTPSDPVLPVTDILMEEELYKLGNGSVSSRLYATWTPPEDPWPVDYVVELYRCTTLAGANARLVYTGSVNGPEFVSISLEDAYYYKLTVIARRVVIGILSPITTTTIYAAGKTAVPSDVTGLSIIPDPKLGTLNVSWDINPELDVSNYEVRSLDSNWGLTGSLFRGNASSCSISAKAADVLNTVYVKARDTLNLVSVTATTTEYTVVAPGAPTGTITPIYSSSTVPRVNVSWTAPVVTSFDIKEYLVRVTRSDATFTEQTTAVTNATLPADWSGSATLTVKSVDTSGNTSAALTASLTKGVPNAVVTTSTVAVDTTALNVSWTEATPSSLPISGYEIRKNNTNWGVRDSNSVWVGSANFTTLYSKTLGVNTWYLNVFDTDNKYAAASKSITYTVVAPSPPLSINTPVFGSSLISSVLVNTVAISWPDAVVTSFPVSKYKVELIHPTGTPIITKFTTTNSVEFNADWLGLSTIRVYTIDLVDNTSVYRQITSTILRPATPSAAIFAISDTSAIATWSAVAKTTLPISGYEIRSENDLAKWGTTSTELKYRGASLTSTFKATDIATSTWYLNAYDSNNVYASSGVAISLTSYTAPNPIISISTEFSTALASANVTFTWTAPTKTTFNIVSYIITLVKPGLTNVTSTQLSTTFRTNADWVGNATISVTCVDEVGLTSTVFSSTVTKLLPSTPSAPIQKITSNAINLDWTDVVKTTLPIAGYEIRATNSNWGQSPIIYKGSASTCNIIDPALGTNTAYLASIDADGKYSTPLAITYGSSVPNIPENITYTFSDPNKLSSNASVTIKWGPPTTVSFSISEYEITLTLPNATVLTITTNSNYWTLPVTWIGTAVFSIKTKDINGRYSSAVVSNIIVNRPSAPTGVTVLVNTNATSITVSWAGATPGSLPIGGYELRPRSTTPGTTGFIWRGNATSTTITSLTIGLNEWDLWTFDGDGIYSSAATLVSYTVVKPSTILATNITGTFNSALTTSSILFKWDAPNSTFGIDYYVASLQYNTPQATTLTSTRNSNDWEVAANWVGNATLSITTYNKLGIPSDVITKIFTKVIPNTPAAVPAATVSDTSIVFDWTDTVKTSLPILGYEVRNTDSGWGTSGYYWKGSASNISINVKGTAPSIITKYIKAYDTDNQYSSSATPMAYTIVAPIAPIISDASFASTSLTAATLTLTWNNITPIFGLAGYEVSDGTTTTIINSNSITLPANWLGAKTFTVKTIDNLNNKSIAATKEAIKYAPDPITTASFRAQVIDNNVLLYWALPAKTTLPISHVLLKSSKVVGSTWLTATSIGEKSGTFTSISELSAGSYVYWIAAVDTDGRESTPISLPVEVSQPPDFIFNKEFTSTFSGAGVTLVNAKADSGGLILPVDLTESFAGHFTTRAWASPAAQVAAGYPIYIQPGISSGSYTEVFDYGTSLGSSQITLSTLGTVISGSPIVKYVVSSSLDNVNWTDYPTITSIFATNFRYVKVALTVTQATLGDLYRLSNLIVRLDAKQKTSSNNTNIVSTDIGGTVVNYTQEFVDVVSVTLSPAGTTALSAVYDLKDTVLTGTYVVVSNVCTVTVANHGLKTGQNVKLSFTTGTAVSGIYTITYISANSYSAAITTANTSGTVSTYPNSMTVYLFDKDGIRQSGAVSWSVRGY